MKFAMKFGRALHKLGLAVAAAAAAIVLVACGGGGSETGGGTTPPPPTPAQRSVSVRIDSALGGGESFQFALGSQSITVSGSGTAVAFGNTLAEGSTYTVNQTAGPRACTLSANRTGTIGTSNVLVTADCGAPPATYTLSVTVTSPLAAGETFVFTRGSGVNVSITQQNAPAAFAGTLATGAAWAVTQLSGPRACTITPSNGIVGSANIVASAACGNPPALTPLTGELRAPVGTQVTLRNNGGDDRALTMPAASGSTDLYNLLAFTFPTALADGAAYSVTVPVKPANQTCSVYKGATGTMPVGTGALKVGCEFTYDNVSRSSANALATRTTSFKVAIGGSDTAVGQTTTPYGEGRFVTFASSAAGLSGNGWRQVFWRDRWTGETRLVSADANGVEGNQNSERPVISADGLTVVFESRASNLVAGDNNGTRDVFLWSAGSGPLAMGLRRISLGTGGADTNGESWKPAVSGDGRFVTYLTSASNIAGAGAFSNVIRRDVVAGTNVVVSTTTGGAPTSGEEPTISEDGNRIAFWSNAGNIVAGDSNGMWDIFVYQHSDGSKRRISLRSDGGERNQGNDSISGVRRPVISGNGRFVAYETTSTNVIPGDTNGAGDIFVVDLDGALGVRRASVGPGSVQGNAASGSFGGDAYALSADGTWLVFQSDATNFGTLNAGRNVFLRNLLTGEVRVITDAPFGTDEVAITRSAAYVAFGSGSVHDGRFASTGQFAHFTNIARAWWWVD